MMTYLPLVAALMTAVVLAGCAPDAPTVPCPVCYEDSWSKEPFTGQPKQHTKTLSPEDLQGNARDAARAMIGTSPTQPQ